MQLDRHGRAHRARPDQRRRPDAGFRVTSTARFARIAADVVATMPEPVRSALAGAEVVHREVPPGGARLDGSVPLVAVEGASGRARRVEIYRRPIEARAVSALDLVELLRVALAREVADVVGLELGEEWDDEDD
jgi:hypothetical protein